MMMMGSAGDGATARLSRDEIFATPQSKVPFRGRICGEREHEGRSLCASYLVRGLIRNECGAAAGGSLRLKLR